MLQEILTTGFKCSERELEQIHTDSGDQLIELVVELAARKFHAAFLSSS